MRRVLVIDDHEPSRKTLVNTLIKSGYKIAGAGVSGNTAVALTISMAPDIVLMAVGLPNSMEYKLRAISCAPNRHLSS